MTGRPSSSTGVVVVVSTAIFADSLLYSAVVPVLPGYAEHLGASPTAIGMLFGSYAVALLIVTPLVGAVAEQMTYRRVLAAGMVTLTLATLLYGVSNTYPALVASRSLQGAAAAVVWTSGVALVAATVERPRLGVAMGAVVAGMSAGLLLGPPLSGVLVEELGFQTPFL